MDEPSAPAPPDAPQPRDPREPPDPGVPADLPVPPDSCDPREPPAPPPQVPRCALLAVDLGLRTGLAGFCRDGRLLWQRSIHLADMGALKRYVRGLLAPTGELPHLEVLVLEGGGPVARVWENAARRRKVRLLRISAEAWRQKLLYPRQQRSGADAKEAATALAREIMAQSGCKRPTSLRHDAAEAVLAGQYAVLELGW